MKSYLWYLEDGFCTEVKASTPKSALKKLLSIPQFKPTASFSEFKNGSASHYERRSTQETRDLLNNIK